MPKVWQFSQHDESQVRQMSAELRISPLMAQVLISRGLTSKSQATDFLNPKLVDLHDPELLPYAAEAADRIVAAIRKGRKITIYGDYDVDGMTATSILWHCLKLENTNVEYYIPCRLEEGYGLNPDAIRQLHEDDPHQLVISVDCGITAVEEAALAKELGLELIITDHHTFLGSSLEDGDVTLPEAACLVHPRLPNSEYPFSDLCGAGVAFKLAWAVCRRLGDGKNATPRMREYLKSAVCLAAIGTVADVVPLLDENRVLVRYGLETLADHSALGLQALIKVAGLDGNRKFTAEDIGFAIAPRLNAAGRLGQARLAVELLTTENPERAAALADYLDELNKNRRTVERRIFKQAKEQVAAHPEWEEQNVLVLSHHDWHAGVIGIVANRVAEHFEKPAILISMNPETQIGQGSGRTFAGCDLHAALTSCSDHLKSYGGHQAAAGLRIHADSLEVFREAFNTFVGDNHQVTEKDLELRIDAEVRLADCTHRAVAELDQLGPFGQKNPRPVFVATRIELAEPPRTMGEGDRHLSMRIRQYGKTLRVIAFGRGEWADEIARADGPISISFEPGINRFRGRESVELQLKDWQPDS
jgi:single-stranded-DNA-specific exonuclease